MASSTASGAATTARPQRSAARFFSTAAPFSSIARSSASPDTGSSAALVGRAEGERVGHHVVAEEPLRELLGVQVEVVLAARGGVDLVELGGQLGEALGHVDHHAAGRHRTGRHNRHGPLAVRGDEVLLAPRSEQVEAEVEVHAPRRHLARGGQRLARDAQVRDHRAALLREARLVEPRHVQAVEQRGHAEHLVHGHDAGAADAHHAHAEVLVADEALGLGQLDAELGRAVLRLLRPGPP